MAILLCMFTSCKDDESEVATYDPLKPVTVTDIMPTTGGISTPVVIAGDNFGTDKTKVKVFFDEREAVVINLVNNYIYALVPKCDGGAKQVKVVVEDQNEGLLTGKTFEYIVSASVTTVASDYMPEFDNMMSIAVDDEQNLIINESSKILLYSGEDNELVTLLDNMYTFQDVHFSADCKDLYLMPYDPAQAALVILHKEENWSREIIFADDDMIDDLSYGTGSMTVDEEGMIYIYGAGYSGGKLYRIDPQSRVITKLGEIAEDNGYSLTYNPRDKYLYLSLYDAQRIIRFPSRKENITNADVENVIGGSNSYILEGEIGNVYGIDIDSDNNLYAAGISDDAIDHVIYKLDLSNREATVLTGKGSNDAGVDGDLSAARFYYPIELCITPDDVIYIMEYFSSRWDFVPSVARLRCLSIQ